MILMELVCEFLWRSGKWYLTISQIHLAQSYCKETRAYQLSSTDTLRLLTSIFIPNQGI